MAEPEGVRHAWAAAARLRSQREDLVAAVASGAMTIDGLFAAQAQDSGYGTVKVVVLAQKVPGVGKVRSRRAMAELGVAEDARWGEVDEAVLRALWSAMADAAALPIVNRTAQSPSASGSVRER